MSEYREALQRLVNEFVDTHHFPVLDECRALLARGEPEHDPALTRNDLPQNLNRIAADIEYCARKVNPAHEVHGLLIGAASALIWLRDESLEPAAAARGEPEPSPRITREEVGNLIREFGLSLVAQLREPSKENDARGAKATRALLEAFEPAAAEKVLPDDGSYIERPPPKGYASWYDAAVDERLKRVAAEKAREPMHEGFPVDTIVRDIFTDKVGTIVSYHCRFEVEWADGSNSMDVHSRQLDHCGPMPSPPAATGDK